MPWRDGITTIRTSSNKDSGFVDVSHTIYELFYRVGGDVATGAMVLLDGYILSSTSNIAVDTHIRLTINDVDVMVGKLRPIEQDGYHTSYKYQIYGHTAKPRDGGSRTITTGVPRSYATSISILAGGSFADKGSGAYSTDRTDSDAGQTGFNFGHPNLQNMYVDSSISTWNFHSGVNRLIADWMSCLILDIASGGSQMEILYPGGSFSGHHWVDAVTELNVIEYNIDYTTDHIFTKRSITCSNGEYTVTASSEMEDRIGGWRDIDIPFRTSINTTNAKNRIGHLWEHGRNPRGHITLKMSTDNNAAWKEDISKLSYIGQKIRIKLPRIGTSAKNYDLWVTHVERHMHWDRADHLEVKLVGFDL